MSNCVGMPPCSSILRLLPQELMATSLSQLMKQSSGPLPLPMVLHVGMDIAKVCVGGRGGEPGGVGPPGAWGRDCQKGPSSNAGAMLGCARFFRDPPLTLSKAP